MQDETNPPQSWQQWYDAQLSLTEFLDRRDIERAELVRQDIAAAKEWDRLNPPQAVELPADPIRRDGESQFHFVQRLRLWRAECRRELCEAEKIRRTIADLESRFPETAGRP